MSKLGRKVNNLIAEIKKGDARAFKKLHSITYNRLTVVALNYLYDSTDVDDALNEAYLRIYKYINSFDGAKDGYNWMCKIVQNAAYNLNAAHGVTVPINKAESQGLFYEIDDGVIESSDLYRAIKTFDSGEQELLYLKFWEDLSYAEIARLKGVKKSTVYKRIAALLKRIENILITGK